MRFFVFLVLFLGGLNGFASSCKTELSLIGNNEKNEVVSLRTQLTRWSNTLIGDEKTYERARRSSEADISDSEVQELSLWRSAGDPWFSQRESFGPFTLQEKKELALAIRSTYSVGGVGQSTFSAAHLNEKQRRFLYGQLVWMLSQMDSPTPTYTGQNLFDVKKEYLIGDLRRRGSLQTYDGYTGSLPLTRWYTYRIFLPSERELATFNPTEVQSFSDLSSHLLAIGYEADVDSSEGELVRYSIPEGFQSIYLRKNQPVTPSLLRDIQVALKTSLDPNKAPGYFISPLTLVSEAALPYYASLAQDRVDLLVRLEGRFGWKRKISGYSSKSVKLLMKGWLKLYSRSTKGSIIAYGQNRFRNKPFTDAEKSQIFQAVSSGLKVELGL